MYVATLVNWWFDSTLGHTSQGQKDKRSNRSVVGDEVKQVFPPDAGIK